MRRRLGIALASFAFGLLLLVLCELGLRATGIGAPPPGSGSRLRYQHVVLPVLRDARRADGTAIRVPADPRVPYQSVLADKPADGLRVVVLGGSAAAGLGFSPNVTFARHLRELLARSAPDRHVEVLNLGVVAFASAQVAAMAEDVLATADADLLVVYSGNNEFLELHAQKFAERDAGFATRLRERLARTNLYRALIGLAGRRQAPSSIGPASEDGLRLSEDVLIQDIDVSDAELRDVLDRYEENLAGIARGAAERGVPALFLTVASNWEWRGRSDLPAGWLDDVLGTAGPLDDARAAAGVAALDRRLEGLDGFARHEALFQRAELHRALGDEERARTDYREAMNLDPHLRRALDAGNARVLALAAREGAASFDVVEHLAARSGDGLVGFDEFYDYVHFSPYGVRAVALGVWQRMIELGLIDAAADVDGERYLRDTLAELDARERDFLEVERWLGFCFDRALIGDRDLWKYDAAVEALDARIAADPGDHAALVYRGNARAFRHDGAAAAAADYRAALALRPDDDATRRNLEALLAERAPDDG